jgi:hypothetical protein
MIARLVSEAEDSLNIEQQVSVTEDKLNVNNRYWRRLRTGSTLNNRYQRLNIEQQGLEAEDSIKI